MNTCSFTIHVKITNACFEMFVQCMIDLVSLKRLLLLLLLLLSQHHSIPRQLLTLGNLRELALRGSGTLTLWTPQTLDLLVTLIS